jgi:hypothetical protein
MRHHLDPGRQRPSLQLGQSGPVRVSADEPDPAYEPPPLIGFSVRDVDTEAVQRLADLSGATFAEAAAACEAVVDAFVHRPLLWQDDGDQA